MTQLLDIKNTVNGYRITEKIYSGSKTLVYRGIKEDGQSVILKLIATEYPSFSEITQFRNQYTITKNLDLPGIVKPLSIENYGNGYVLVMEDFGGISLADWQRGIEIGNNPLTLSQFFPIAIEIVSTLEGLHRYRIIHKDIKPANILINPSTGEVKVIDFSIATLLPREIQFLTNPNVLEGTLAYISPEQTGRMNRGIDYRSDFYSLGVTFFELLTGQLPFTATDPIELVYSHIAKPPLKASDINADIPPILSDIITKLMAKNAEDRYQGTQGLKHDLETCRNQWQTGNIATFELGMRDISDRFLIPEKLYGRQHEVETLLAAFERVTGGTTEMMLVAGFSGIGKTAVVNEVHKPIARQRSYFIKGKFDQFQRDIPLSGLIQAFRDLIGQLLSETDAQVQHWKTNILSALGEQAQVITDIIPELEQIIGKQPEISELSGSAAQNRFNLLFQRFVQVFTTKEHPLVIFLDDLQWADAASLKFIELLMSQTNIVNKNPYLSSPEITEDFSIPMFQGNREVDEIPRSDETAGGLLLIGAYRDNEVSKAHPLCLTLQEIEKLGATINEITLRALNQSELNSLIADTLKCEEILAVPLTQIIFAKTTGNPFFATQLLTYLHKDGIIKFSFDIGFWLYDIAETQAIALTDGVVDFMAIQLRKLPKNTQQALMLAACIGNEFDLQTLATVYEKTVEDTASDVWKALHKGLIVTQSNVYKLFQHDDAQKENFESKDSKELSVRNLQIPKYKFIHDRVQQAAYSLIPEDQRKQIHLKIGLLLLNNTPVAEREANIFQLVNHFNIAVELIADRTKHDELAQMNLVAGRKALASTAYLTAVRYLTTGIELLTSDSWENKYELSLALYETTAEAAYLAGQFEQMERLVEVVLVQAKTLLEKVKVYEVKIQAYGAQNKALEAVNIALDFLKLLGVDFPENSTQSDIQIAMTEVATNLSGKRIEDLIDLPEMREVEPLAVMRILSSITALAYQTVPELFPLFALEQINLSIKYGNSILSAYVYVVYGLILCGVLGDIESGYKFGQLALGLLDKFNAKEVNAKNSLTFNIVIRHYKEHIRETLKPLLETYYSGIETGDLEFAAYSLMFYNSYSYFIGRELVGLSREMATYSDCIIQTKQEIVFNWNSIYRQIVLNLIGTVENPCFLTGEAYNEEKLLPIQLKAKDRSGILYLYFGKLYLCYLFHELSQAVENATLAEKYLDGVTGQLIVPQFYFYDSLARLALYHVTEASEQKQILGKVTANQKKMQHWAYHAPMNFLHKFYLVEAERHRILAEYVEAMELYDRAITLAKENEYINEEALANELAAKFYLEWGKQKIAQTYLIDAYYAYSRWGAKAKVNDLTKRYPQLFAPILQQEKFSSHPSHKTTSNNKSLSTLSDRQTIIGFKTSISDSLDLAALIKASQVLSGEIELEQLVSTLIKVVMENAGASKCALILSKGNNSNLTLAAVGSSSTTKFPSICLELSDDVPITLVNYVKRTLEILVIDDAKTNTFLVGDRYIIREQPYSLLCIPIINQRKLLGILYLENNLTTGAFTRDRLEVLQLLTTQAAISLENAILYKNLAQANQQLIEYNQTLEEKIEKRTQELNDKNQSLQQAIQDLQHTQSQLIQSEKMSSLGQMVAGIAHEINNPISFIYGNISHINKYFDDLLNLITVYQQEYRNPSPIVREKIEEIDMNFLAEDLPKILDSMAVGSSRICNIILSLRNFSRLDESDMKPVNIHEGIDNTLMILQHRLQEQSERPKIEVFKEYGQLPNISCYAGLLNQVFMNILSNAIDALEELVVNSKTTNNGELTADNPKICIYTELLDNHTVRIRIADNGCGITEAVLHKIFDPFFTTKPVGSGTGLGLSISYKVVVDKHKGQLICNSTPGQGTEFVLEIPIQP